METLVEGIDPLENTAQFLRSLMVAEMESEGFLAAVLGRLRESHEAPTIAEALVAAGYDPDTTTFKPQLGYLTPVSEEDTPAGWGIPEDLWERWATEAAYGMVQVLASYAVGLLGNTNASPSHELMSVCAAMNRRERLDRACGDLFNVWNGLTDNDDRPLQDQNIELVRSLKDAADALEQAFTELRRAVSDGRLRD